MIYTLYDAGYMAFAPMRWMAEAASTAFRLPFAPISYTDFGRNVAAGADVLGGVLRRRAKPEWSIRPVTVAGEIVPVEEAAVARRPFCVLKRFRAEVARTVPKVLLVAPLSGHHATLLRDTVQSLVRDHEVFVTDWIDARLVPLDQGNFGLDAYIAHVLDFMRLLQPDLHVMAVCQPAPPVLAAVSLLAAGNDPAQPLSMTLMGGPIDCRAAATAATELAERFPLSWFEKNVIATVPAWYPGRLRRVYPGFVQLGAFLAMNPDRHMKAHVDMFHHLVRGDGESAAAQQRFYDEYLAVLDVTAEYYLETVQTVFQEHRLATGRMTWAGHKVDPAAIRRTALMTVEGELDDISAPGQTVAAHALCANLPAERKRHLLQPSVGHFGIFNGRRWRTEIFPQVAAFIADSQRAAVPA